MVDRLEADGEGPVGGAGLGPARSAGESCGVGAITVVLETPTSRPNPRLVWVWRGAGCQRASHRHDPIEPTTTIEKTFRRTLTRVFLEFVQRTHWPAASWIVGTGAMGRERWD